MAGAPGSQQLGVRQQQRAKQVMPTNDAAEAGNMRLPASAVSFLDTSAAPCYNSCVLCRRLAQG